MCVWGRGVRGIGCWGEVDIGYGYRVRGSYSLFGNN